MKKFSFDPNALYRMPVVFGPTCGPRQSPDGGRFDGSKAPFTVASAQFLTDADALRALLPDRYTLRGDPIVTVEHSILHDLAWLAGRSYSMLGVKIPVTFDSATGPMTGAFLSVLWENRPEPILSGRDELGFGKVFCDLPEALVTQQGRTYRASWDGHTFFTMRLSNLTPATRPTPPPTDGVFHYAYSPDRSRQAPHEDCAQTMLSPTPTIASKIVEYQTADCELSFDTSSFEQLPTMYQIVNVLAALPIIEMKSASFLRGLGKSDLNEQRYLA